jgi:glutamate-1-semialdehyde 2,1-aminomutase
MKEHITERAKEIAYGESRRLLDRTRASKALYERAVEHLPQGVPSSFQAGDPYPIYLREGRGSHVWDVDDNEYVDTHGGFGSMLVGHAHPKIVEAITRAAQTGTHFAAPTEEMVRYAEELCRRFQLEKVRFANSGTEATMSAIRVARAATGRDDIVKIEGSYHGHHEQVMFSVVPNADVMGGREQPSSTPMSLGVPKYLRGHTHVVPFNDLEVLQRLLEERGDEIACLIIEPVMMNIGIAEPEPGYLQGLKDLLHRYGALLIFDEVKCGAAIAPGGATERYGVRPDLACFAKAIAGGTPGAAFGGRDDVMETIERGAAQQGTYNGNPLVAAAGLAALTEVLVPDAYEHLAKLGTRMASGCAAAMTQYGIPGHAVDLGAKGCVSYRPAPLRNYRDFLEANDELFTASYPWMVNRGVFMTPGDEEQWTLSVQHTEADVDRYVDAFTDLCAELAKG